DQRAPVLRCEIKSELVAFYRSPFPVWSFEPCRDVVAAQPGRIEPVFERSDGAVVLEGAAIPEAFKRRDFVIAGPFVSLQRVSRIGSKAFFEEVKPLLVIGRRLKAIHRDNRIVRIERRSVAPGAALAL